MPTLTGEKISSASYALLRAAGGSEGHAKIVADHIADANLVGHDSHGLIRIPQYLDEIKAGRLDPAREPEVVRESAGTAQVDGNTTFGQVAATFATRIAMEKARQCGISLVTMANQGHTGRIGAYPEIVSKEGMAGIMCTGLGRGRTSRVAPFGGRLGRLGTNPISMSFPYSDEAQIVMDFATSMAAEGKVRVSRARGELLPDEWLLSPEGKPSREPNDLYNGGAILPMGGVQGGHKGYGLSFMIALLGGMTAELACDDLGQSSFRNGSSLIVINLPQLAPIEEVREQVEDWVQYVKDTPPMQGHKGVLYPGEIEANVRRKRSAEGVPVEDSTWDEIAALMKEYGLEEVWSASPDGGNRDS